MSLLPLAKTLQQLGAAEPWRSSPAGLLESLSGTMAGLGTGLGARALGFTLGQCRRYRLETRATALKPCPSRPRSLSSLGFRNLSVLTAWQGLTSAP